MLKHKRCPLTLKFGKDIASIIWKIMWQREVECVNKEYHSMYRFEHNYLTKQFDKGLLITVNDRCNNGWHSYSLVCNMKTRKQVAKLHKHYWKIKELY